MDTLLYDCLSYFYIYGSPFIVVTLAKLVITRNDLINNWSLVHYTRSRKLCSLSSAWHIILYILSSGWCLIYYAMCTTLRTTHFVLSHIAYVVHCALSNAEYLAHVPCYECWLVFHRIRVVTIIRPFFEIFLPKILFLYSLPRETRTIVETD